jgi:hypothetical protein
MKLVLIAGVACAATPVLADPPREIDLELDPAFYRAVDVDYYGTEIAVTMRREHVGVRAALGLGVAPTRMDYNNSDSGRLGTARFSLGPFLQARPQDRVRLVAGAGLGVGVEQWPSSDGNYVDSAFVLALGARIGGSLDLAHIGDATLWIGPFAEADWRPITLGNTVRDQATAVSLLVALGVRL